MQTVEIFQNLAFPIAVCCILFISMGFFLKYIAGVITKRLEVSEEERKENTKYLMEANSKLIATVDKNTEAILKFSYLLENYLKKNNN